MTDDSARIDELETEVAELENEKAAHPIELFFDLVFVFAFTQVVSLIVHDLTLEGVLRGSLLLGLLWWGWSTWTWALNAVDISPRVVRVVVLASMFGVFTMAFAIPHAFDGDGMWVAGGYTFVRVLAMVVLVLGTRHDASEQRAVLLYSPTSLTAPLLVLIGAAVGGSAMQWIWFAALVVEVAAAVFAGRADWKIDAGHFSERHGLILIIALGEAVIVVGAALGEDEDVKIESVATALFVGLLAACVMWWAYFDRLQDTWEQALREADDHETSHVARDVYTLLHYPMIVGIVFIAVAMEEAFLHPDERIDEVVGTLFWVGFGLYLLAMAAATWRCWRSFLYERLVGVAAIALLVAFVDVDAERTVLGATIILVITISAEYWRFRDRIRAFNS